MRLGYGVLLAAAFCFLSFPATQTDASPRLRLTTDRDWYVCNVSGGIGSYVIVYVLLDYSSGTNGMAFAAPFPANSGYVLMGSDSPFTVTGDLESGVDISFGSCLNGNVVVMQVVLVKSTAGDPCTFFSVAPHPTYGDVTYTDCQSVRHELRHGSGIVLNSDGSCEQARPPHNPFPPHGGTGVSLLTNLVWSFDEPECCTEISGRRDVLYFGTTPDPPIKWDVSSPEPVGPLQAATTYYWKIRANAYGCVAESPVWSFTTTDKVATNSATWGAIKALYR